MNSLVEDVVVSPMAALRLQAGKRPQGVAFQFGAETWTYERLLDQAGRLARGLTRLGLRRGHRVALHMTNRPEMLVAYYACFRLNLIAAPLRTAFKPAELAPLLQRLQPEVYIGEAALYDNVAPIDTSILPHQKRVVVGTVSDQRVGSWDDLFDDSANGNDRTAENLDAVAVLINTSGTTGLPKFVAHTASTLARSAELMVEHWGFKAEDVIVEQLTLAHASGLFTALSYIRLGAPFVLLPAFAPDLVLDTIEHHRCTYMVGFPSQFAALLDEQSVRPRDLQSLRHCLTGGDTCPVELQDRAPTVFGAPLHNIWAATEVAGTFAYGLQSGPVQRLVEGAQAKLVDDDGRVVARGEIGELCIRGPNVSIGYWNEPSATRTAFREGWYHTGDLVRQGEGSDFWFVARKKDIIIRGGTNISPAEVEGVLATHPSVRDAAVAGVPDPVLGQRVFGFVTLEDGAPEDIAAEILAACATQLAAYKVPEGLTIVDTLPLTALGKLDRTALAALAAR